MADYEKRSYIAPGGPVTLADIAKLAGVSPVTVSRAINTPALVKPRTLEVIERVIAK
ncbi:LacI family DNA-binding transcriptional regulator, partial [Agrobacterium tumefaciens]